MSATVQDRLAIAVRCWFLGFKATSAAMIAGLADQLGDQP